MKILKEREYFIRGLKFVVSRVKPESIVVYGAAPDNVFGELKEKNIKIIQFDSDIASSRKSVIA